MNTSIEKIRLVISYIFSHKSNREIAKIVEISRETVSKIKSLLILNQDHIWSLIGFVAQIDER
ncbi:hypothetical protein DC346_03165 [Acinetobacter junii]|uniref:HTH luxR-type domain-containing protein n=1 Tax=Acinetobacter junii TaxID=40215 RepID=A0A365PMF6_ACIJU|nr:hypothetical protein DDF86_00950 [Acinetobacter junii]RBA42755.1 hypothetical protein DDG62_01815 [Acinetobacter junii]RBA49405.1 hypothetical protein DC346_03165 [Acinetobacter junii]